MLWSCGLWFLGKNQEIEKNILMIISKLGEVLENCKNTQLKRSKWVECWKNARNARLEESMRGKKT